MFTVYDHAINVMASETNYLNGEIANPFFFLFKLTFKRSLLFNVDQTKKKKKYSEITRYTRYIKYIKYSMNNKRERRKDLLYSSFFFFSFSFYFSMTKKKKY